ncbi:hypothetical protein ACF8OI_09300 [Aeromonas bivalvium]|uniref:hypothetical protein n=1 Tax=Aeromonas bivalvium TaxID=440079 RepID=UPI00370AF411
MSSFALTLNDMRDHYKSNIKAGRQSRYHPKQEHVVFFQSQARTSLSDNGQDVVQGLERYAQSLGQEECATIETGITAETQTLKNDKVSTAAQDAFRAALERKRIEAKEQAAKNVDRIYDEALRIGEAHPEAQGAILGVLESVGTFFQALFDKIVTFISKIVANILEWVKNAWESIKSTFNTISAWVSGWFG